MRKEAGLSATVRVTLGSLEVMRVGAWGPVHLFNGESKEARQSWVGGLLLGNRRGCLDSWKEIWAVDLPMSLYARAGTQTWWRPQL